MLVLLLLGGMRLLSDDVIPLFPTQTLFIHYNGIMLNLTYPKALYSAVFKLCVSLEYFVVVTDEGLYLL